MRTFDKVSGENKIEEAGFLKDHLKTIKHLSWQRLKCTFCLLRDSCPTLNIFLLNFHFLKVSYNLSSSVLIFLQRRSSLLSLYQVPFLTFFLFFIIFFYFILFYLFIFFFFIKEKEKKIELVVLVENSLLEE